MKDLTGSINFNPSPPTAGLSLGADFDAQAQRIRQLERQVNDLGSAIAMSAAYLGLIPLERGAGVVTRDQDWMGVFIEKAIEVRRKRLAADRDRLAIAAGLVATSRQT